MIGGLEDCRVDPDIPYDGDNDKKENCTQSWVFENDFYNKRNHT
jgi:hypothetical protein